ncbi:hypothetical protein A1Q1_00890 [Trichosporon asahii var. asahii CBS 2479]|uniref:ATP-dependent DNA ligase family profile domain-containing protein n=1 Tax=Trichosporon asahii var. asahii (strain ATCC 90039 / CBS 2479 / JCM 2466 / KCTC 7840 / NBRC 103889/ NCYC 2677 / UAMH 7654) TaxID=1186058 RepID=J6EZ56_TRIAS|nr:hypothetical protein A1Q1_00890 [Trichosporon asahii var. asahii CBS 2479]EJT49959.1 hypothetical protein A1Q1_00890 [Trichosporon asahii var. asahii CBS 2479]
MFRVAARSVARPAGLLVASRAAARAWSTTARRLTAEEGGGPLFAARSGTTTTSKDESKAERNAKAKPPTPSVTTTTTRTPPKATGNKAPPPSPPPAPAPEDPLAVLACVDELRRRTAAENSRQRKVEIIREYEDLRELISFVYQPHIRLGVSPRNLQSFLSSADVVQHAEGYTSPRTLIDLFRSLPGLSGHTLRYAITDYLVTNKIWCGPEAEREAAAAAAAVRDGRETPYATFVRLVGRSLNAGWGANTLTTVWPDVVGEGAPATVKKEAPVKVTRQLREEAVEEEEDNQHVEEEAAAPASTHAPINLKSFKVALGTTITAPFAELFKTPRGGGINTWYASRKLDGVRCITFVDVLVPKSTARPLRIVDMQFLSRSGNHFTSLDNLRAPLDKVASLPGLRAWLDADPLAIAQSGVGVVKRLVLDGEACVLVKHGADFEEDFHATVSQVKRKDTPIANPAYFLLDVLPWHEFAGVQAKPGLASTFMERNARLNSLVEHCGTPSVRAVEQTRVTGQEVVDDMVERAVESGWEGLVFRLDAPYKGKRSKDVFKFKNWQDAEYTVLSLDTSVQRLPVDGVYGEYEACANVWIEHKGHRVSVGSGFTPDQRLRYARDPSLIVGRQITVEYFEESPSEKRDGVMSLRFPRVKEVWEEGKRDI